MILNPNWTQQNLINKNNSLKIFLATALWWMNGFVHSVINVFTKNIGKLLYLQLLLP